MITLIRTYINPSTGKLITDKKEYESWQQAEQIVNWLFALRPDMTSIRKETIKNGQVIIMIKGTFQNQAVNNGYKYKDKVLFSISTLPGVPVQMCVNPITYTISEDNMEKLKMRKYESIDQYLERVEDFVNFSKIDNVKTFNTSVDYVDAN